MRFPEPLVRATLLQRYKRFLADVELADGSVVTAHCPNPGAMLGLNAPGLPCWLAPAAPTAKLPFRLELVEADGGLVGVNTQTPNRLVAEALAEDRLDAFAGYDRIRPERRYGEASRIDFLLEAEGRPPCYLEVKNVHLMRTPGLAEFPDCKAARSAKHMAELAQIVRDGARAAVAFIVQREDCDRFAPAGDLDPGFAAALSEAHAAGVEVHVYGCEMRTEGVQIARTLAFAG